MDTREIRQLKERKGSAGDITEYLRKKREREKSKSGEENVVRTSKIVAREKQTGEEERVRDREEWERELREEVRKDIKAGLKILGEEIREEIKEIKDSITRQGEEMLGDMKRIRDELRERERKWEEEKREVRELIKKVERKLERWTKEGEEREMEGGRNVIGGRGEGELESRVKTIERKMEWKERGDRKKNIVIRRVEMEKGDVRRGVEEVIGSLGIEIKIENVRKVGRAREGERGMAVVTLGSIEQKKRVMENKNKLRGREERIEEDLTWEERKIRWKLREIARREEGEGRRVRIGYGGLQINGKWWKWSEEEGVLKNEGGEIKDVGMGEDKQGN